MGELRRKGILLLLSMLMLVGSGAYLTYAWYTKATSVSGMTFDAAQWEFTANYEVSDFAVNVNSYTTYNKGKAAPGTAGEIPITLRAEKSDTNVDYEIYIDKSTMSPEFQERIYFYSDANRTKLFDKTTGPIEGTIPRGGEVEAVIYWEWVYEMDDVPTDVLEKVTERGTTSADWDAFDTYVGKKPDVYEPMMSAKVSIVGTQSSPVPEPPAT